MQAVVTSHEKAYPLSIECDAGYSSNIPHQCSASSREKMHKMIEKQYIPKKVVKG